MPLPVSTTSAGTMPGGSGLQTTGGGDLSDPTELTSAVTPAQGAAGSAAGGAQWMPVFQIGAGQEGVSTTARGLISGYSPPDGTVAQKVGAAATAATQAGLAANTPTAAGSATGTAGTAGGAADLSAGGGGLPPDPNINNPGGETAQQNQDYLNSLGNGGG